MKKEKLKAFKSDAMNLFGDIRDKFMPGVPIKTPADFKPLDVHLDKCKICYSNEMDCVLMPCKCFLFCFVCGSELKIKVCPLCRQPFDECVKVYNDYGK